MQITDFDIDYIVNRYTDLLLRFCAAKIREEADRYDILQEVFVAFLKSKGDFKDEVYVKNWLYKVASYKIDDFLRK
ncbi:MAG: sigma-70 family RNA polymerase sigma factor, partial [Firmicutes bacterium]|nr:sigma-70 family RNA polymerase sigma factor [Bacillota bacterium]